MVCMWQTVRRFFAPTAEQRSAVGNTWLDFIPAGTATPAADALAAVHRCISLISGDMARLPIETRRAGELVEDESFAAIAAAGGMLSGFELRRQVQADCLRSGNGFAWIGRSPSGEVQTLTHVDPQRVMLHEQPGLREFRIDSQPIDYSDLLHIRSLPAGGHPLWGTSPLAQCRTAVELAATQDQTGVEAMRNAGLGKVAIVHPASMAPEAKAALSEAYTRNHTGAKNLARPIVLSEGMKVEKVSDPFAQSAWLDSRRFQVTEIGRIFGIPGQLLFSVDGGTLSSVYEAYRLYVDGCLSHWAAVWSAELQRKVSPELAVSLPTAQMLRSSPIESAQTWTSLVSAGVATRNEARAIFGLPPIDGLDTPVLRLDTAPTDGSTDE